VAEAVVRLTLADDPPKLVEFGGPELLTGEETVDVFEQVLGEPIRRRHVPVPRSESVRSRCAASDPRWLR
jgi:uncharacterized protein YbjT (DUF2867 family)